MIIEQTDITLDRSVSAKPGPEVISTGQLARVSEKMADREHQEQLTVRHVKADRHPHLPGYCHQALGRPAIEELKLDRAIGSLRSD